MICNKVHRYHSFFLKLPDDQGGEGRHKCAGCAYEKGLTDGKKKSPKHVNLDDLPISQAGTVRHKSPHAAYELGYADGIANP